MAQLNWVESGETNAGVTERGFAVERQGQTIPGVFWQPSATGGRRPLVLMVRGMPSSAFGWPLTPGWNRMKL